MSVERDLMVFEAELPTDVPNVVVRVVRFDWDSQPATRSIMVNDGTETVLVSSVEKGAASYAIMMAENAVRVVNMSAKAATGS